MKKLFTAALLVGLLAFSGNSFGQKPKEYMMIEYTFPHKEYQIITVDRGYETIKTENKGLQDVLKKLSVLAEDGWRVSQLSTTLGNYYSYTYLLERE